MNKRHQLSDVTASKISPPISFLWILSLFIATFFIYKDFNIRMIFGFGILGMLWGLFSFKIFFHFDYELDLSFMHGAYILLTLILFIQFLAPHSLANYELFSYGVSLALSYLFILRAAPKQVEYEKISFTFIITASFFAFYIVIFSIFKTAFWSVVFPILSNASREYAQRFIPRGYAPVLGGSATYMIYVLFTALSFLAAHIVTGIRGQNKPFIFITAIIFFYAILITGRRGELLMAVSTFFFFTILQAPPQKKLRRTIQLVTALGFCFVLFLLMMPILAKVPFFTRYVMTVRNLVHGRDITSGRTVLYKQAYTLFTQHPVFGIGWGQFGQHVTENFKAVHGQDVNSVHNIYLQFLTETGIIGTILILIPLGFIYIKTVRQTIRLTALSTTNKNFILTKRMNAVSFLLQTFFLLLGLLDPCFYKLIFWYFYAIAFSFSATALKLEQHILSSSYDLSSPEASYEKSNSALP